MGAIFPNIILFRMGVTTKNLLVNFCPDLFQAEVEETLKRIQSHKGVIGTMVVNAEGKDITSFLLDLQKATKPLLVVPHLSHAS